VDELGRATERSAFKAEFAAFSPARRVDSRRLMILLPFGRERDRTTGGFMVPTMWFSLTKNVGDLDSKAKTNRRIKTAKSRTKNEQTPNMAPPKHYARPEQEFCELGPPFAVRKWCPTGKPLEQT
jgi:hypothetical protein